ncbi:MAG: hypothetical protein WAO91_05310 [Candidatus Nitrosotenuis sp.]
MTKTKTSKAILGLAMTAMVFGLMLSPVSQNQAAASEDKIVAQKLTKANVPVTLPLTKGYVDGFEVFYISTEASDKDLAEQLTKLTGARVAFTPALEKTPAESLANIYAFKNGISGSGPLGFQPNVADSKPGDAKYSPLWKVNMVEWKSGVKPRELRSETDILAAAKKNELTITPTKLVVNCPMVKWQGGALKIRSNKTLTDESQYGGGQVLSIDTKKMQVTFVGHRGFAPDGSTIYYIATDASVKDVADALGVVFAPKTGATLKSGASSDLFVFTNGISGTGPLGFQASIASTNVGDAFYSPLWRIQATTWKDAAKAQFLTKASEITSEGSNGALSTSIAGAVVNCPFVEVSEKSDANSAKKPRNADGNLTAPSADKPFGGAAIGKYSKKVMGDKVSIVATLNLDASKGHMVEGHVLEGWLVDADTNYKLSLGKLDERGKLSFTQRMVNPSIYDLLVITQEPINDTDPNPLSPIGGAKIN